MSPFLGAGWEGEQVTPHPSVMAIYNLREQVYYAGIKVLDEGYLDANGNLHERLGSKTTHSWPGAIVTEWSNGSYRLVRSITAGVDPSLGYCKIDYQIYVGTQLAGTVGIGVVWNYDQTPGGPTIAYLSIRGKMLYYYADFIDEYSGITHPKVGFKICYGPFDDCMTQDSIDPNYKLIGWSGGSPEDFKSQGIYYGDLAFSPVTTGVNNQPNGSCAIWGIVHLPIPSTLDVYTDPDPPFQVGPINEYTQYTCVGYGFLISAPVGGTAFSPNKLALIAPYIILAALIAIASASVAVYWRRCRT